MALTLVQHFQLGHWAKAESISDAVRIIESARLLNRSMFKSLFLEGTIDTERVLGLSKSFVAISVAPD